MAFNKVQDGTSVTSNGGATLVVTFTSAITANNLIVVFFVSNAAPGTTPTGYTAIGPATAFCDTILYYKVAAGGETSMTVAQSVATGGAAYWAEWSGVATGSPVDVSALGNSLSAAGGVLTGPAVTTTNANDLILAADGDDSAVGGFASMGGGFTQDRTASATGTGTLVTVTEGNRIVAATGTYTPTFNNAQNPANNAAITVAFKAAPPFIAPRAVNINQSPRRSMVVRTVPRSHLAAAIIGIPVQLPPMASGAVVLQALRRPLVGRTVPKPHVAPVNLTPPVPPLQPAIVVSQCLRRPYVGRTCPRSHVAAPNLTPPPLSTTIVVSQAGQRSHRRPRPPLPHLAPPSLASPPFGPALLISQAVWRSGRRIVPRPHLVPAIRGPVPTTVPFVGWGIAP